MRRTRSMGMRGRRGSILIALVVALIALSLVVLGVCAMGQIDQSLSVLRLNKSSAEAAAEAGANMAVREYVSGTDEDNDGGIGSISDDGSTANDIAVGAGKVYVQRSASGADVLLTSIGTCGTASAKVLVTLTGVQQTAPTAFFRSAAAKKIQVSLRDNTTFVWSTPTDSGATHDTPEWIVAKSSRINGGKTVVAMLDHGNDLSIGQADPATGVATYVDVCTDTGQYTQRMFDIACEANSGRTLVVYYDNTAGNKRLRYRTYDGTTLSSAVNTGLATGNVDWVVCRARPAGNQILSLCLDDSLKVQAMLWDGTSWGGAVTLQDKVEDWIYECFDGAYENVSENPIVVYPDPGSKLLYRKYSNGAWGAETTIVGNLGTKARWIRLAPRPGTNEVLCAIMGDNQHYYMVNWSGTAWGAVTEITTPSGAKDRRQFDLAYTPDGATALMVYSNNNAVFYYRTYSAGVWSAATAGPNTGGKTWIAQLRPGPGTDEITGCIANDSNNLWAFRYSAGAFGSVQKISTDIGADDKYERFCIDPGYIAPRVKGWASVAP